VFVYRDPLEVLVSQARMPALYMVPGSLVGHGLNPPPELMTRPLEHAAWVLGRILRDARTALARHEGGLLVDYRELPEAIETRIAAHFGLDLQAANLAALRRVCQRDAKNPHLAYQSDSSEKQAAANAGLRDAARRWLDEPYAELSALLPSGGACGPVRNV
jgi:hypothetical protein